MIKILANDGLSPKGANLLKKASFELFQDNISQNELSEFINRQQIEVLLVRSTTKVQAALIDACLSLKLIGRGGVGMDNIDVEYVQKKGIKVINTPNASSHSVAELVFAHIMSMARYLHDSNRSMPLQGDTHFEALKKVYSSGCELRGKTLGVLGAGRIGLEVIKVALALGMKVKVFDMIPEDRQVTIDFFDGRKISFNVPVVSKEEVLKSSDFITLHVPRQKNMILGKEEFKMMKKGSGIVNTSRGGLIDEKSLLTALNRRKIAYAAFDVYNEEPKPSVELLMHPAVSLSPHIGGSTRESQERIGLELAEQIISFYRK